jgi:phosphodiesterase/alkaline phosphatase D-like protein
MGKQTAKQSVGSGAVTTVAPAYITGLTKNTTYYYRLVAENQYGRAAGAQRTLRTSGVAATVSGAVPTAKTFPATEITKSSAVLRGEVNPNNGLTQYWFEYGRTSRLGNTTSFVSLGNGSASIVATAEPKLNANTTYYFRINAQNEYGTVNGEVRTFKTSR